MNGRQEQTFELHWYPGHMAKWDKAFNTHVQQVDVVVEVLDARMPQMSRHIEIYERVKKQQKPMVTVLNKQDLADSRVLAAWVAYLEQHEERVITLDAQRGTHAKKALIAAVVACGEEAQKRWVAKGLKPRPIRTMVMGMPNVGKSSLINGLIGRKKLQTGHKAGVTRETQWVRVHPQVELLDSPGILPPKLDKQDEAHWLALVSSIGEAAFDDEEIARTCLAGLMQHYPERLQKKYTLSGEPETWDLEAIALSANLLKKGGQPDALRAAQRFIYDVRQGELGGLCFQFPPTLNDVIETPVQP
jgi:ribosome biogenesis GTPase A